jgi:hypothetical protein
MLKGPKASSSHDPAPEVVEFPNSPVASSSNTQQASREGSRTGKDQADSPAKVVQVSIRDSLRIAENHSDSSKINTKKTWTPSFVSFPPSFTIDFSSSSFNFHIQTLAVAALTKVFHCYKDDVHSARTVMRATAMPKPIHMAIKKVYVPRRSDLNMPGMSDKEKTGLIKAEYVDAVNTDWNEPAKRIILYAHGYIYQCSPKQEQKCINLHVYFYWRLHDVQP